MISNKTQKLEDEYKRLPNSKNLETFLNEYIFLSQELCGARQEAYRYFYMMLAECGIHNEALEIDLRDELDKLCESVIAIAVRKTRAEEGNRLHLLNEADEKEVISYMEETPSIIEDIIEPSETMKNYSSLKNL